jgi:hypothetical protein
MGSSRQAYGLVSRDLAEKKIRSSSASTIATKPSQGSREASATAQAEREARVASYSLARLPDVGRPLSSALSTTALGSRIPAAM